MKTILSRLWLGITAAGMLCIAAAGTPQTPTVKLEPGDVLSLDFTNMTFTVAAKATNLTIRITSETRFFLHGKPALSKDMEPGDHVKGKLRETAGKLEAVRIHIDKLSPK